MLKVNVTTEPCERSFKDKKSVKSTLTPASVTEYPVLAGSISYADELNVSVSTDFVKTSEEIRLASKSTSTSLPPSVTCMLYPST